MNAPVHQPFATDEWWRTAVIYQIYPRSFADGDGDGIGDLPGIISRLDHLAALGVDAIWLSPFYRSPQKDAGYDVADYRDIDPLFGTLEDADALIARAHELGMRIIVDLVPNHSSDQHAWFQAALAAGPGSPERARYLFRDGRGEGGAQPPNNWESVFGGPAWTRVTEADGNPGQWYLHLFDSSQPDFDWQHPQVRAEFHDVLRFWCERGVDGFRVDVAHGLVKKEGLPDWGGHVAMVSGIDDAAHAGAAPVEHVGEEPRVVTSSAAASGIASATDDDAADDAADVDLSGSGVISGEVAPMFDQDGVHEIYEGWRRVLNEFTAPGEHHSRALVAEAWVEPQSRLARYVRERVPPGHHRVAGVLDAVGAPATWVLSNHDVVRHPSRLGLPTPGARPNGIAATDVQPDEALGLRRARAATAFMLALPGSAYVYQGEELGLPEHTALPPEVRQDPTFFRTQGAEVGRDGCRVPLPWAAAEPGFGFSPTGKTWLPQPAPWAGYAVDAQDGVEGSTLELYRRTLRLRRERALGAGGLTWVDGFGPDVLAFRNFPADDGAAGPAPTGAGTADAGTPAAGTGGSGAPGSATAGAGTVVVANLGTTPVPLPAGAEVLLTSVPLDTPGTLPPDTTVWLAG